MNISEKGFDPEAPLAFLDDKESRFPLAVEAFRNLPEIQAAFAIVVMAARRHGDDFWSDSEARCREILYLCDGDRQKFKEAVAEWVNFSYEFLIKQRTFLKTGNYASHSFEVVRRELYDDDARMQNFYLIALMFSFLFSSNYVGFFSFFRRRMLTRMQGAQSVCDIGCGHGVYLTQMMLAEPASKGVGVDISAGSLETTKRLLSCYGIAPSRYRLSKGDVQERLPVVDASQDAVTCFEVIEHLERPEAAVAELRRVLKRRGTLCMSTAIRMESIDHIHLFHTPDEVRRLVESHGFTVVEDEVVPLTTEDISDPAVRERLIDDPRTPLGIVLLAS